MLETYYRNVNILQTMLYLSGFIHKILRRGSWCTWEKIRWVTFELCKIISKSTDKFTCALLFLKCTIFFVILKNVDQNKDKICYVFHTYKEFCNKNKLFFLVLVVKSIYRLTADWCSINIIHITTSCDA